MTLKQLESLIKQARAAGATDATTVYLSNSKLKYMRDIKSVEYQKRENWPEKDWPVVITAKQ